MKKIIGVVVVLIVFLKWNSIITVVNPLPDYSAELDGNVVLYATTWCGYCTKARKLMKEHDIEYQEYDIEKSQEGREQYDNLGGGGVPLLIINGEIVKGFDPQKILKLAGRT